MEKSVGEDIHQSHRDQSHLLQPTHDFPMAAQVQGAFRSRGGAFPARRRPDSQTHGLIFPDSYSTESCL
jgi:hypothetical protein